jgi:hypothetical protein
MGLVRLWSGHVMRNRSLVIVLWLACILYEHDEGGRGAVVAVQ